MRARGAWRFAARWAGFLTLWIIGLDVLRLALAVAGVTASRRDDASGVLAHLALNAGRSLALGVPVGLGVFALNDWQYRRRVARAGGRP